MPQTPALRSLIGRYRLHAFGAVALLLLLMFLWVFNFTAFFGALPSNALPRTSHNSEIRGVEVVRAPATPRVYFARDLADQLTI